jgi:hypothetical protein
LVVHKLICSKSGFCSSYEQNYDDQNPDFEQKFIFCSNIIPTPDVGFLQISLRNPIVQWAFGCRNPTSGVGMIFEQNMIFCSKSGF